MRNKPEVTEHNKKDEEMEGFDPSLPVKNQWTKVNEQMGLLKKEREGYSAAFDQLIFERENVTRQELFSSADLGVTIASGVFWLRRSRRRERCCVLTAGHGVLGVPRVGKAIVFRLSFRKMPRVQTKPELVMRFCLQLLLKREPTTHLV